MRARMAAVVALGMLSSACVLGADDDGIVVLDAPPDQDESATPEHEPESLDVLDPPDDEPAQGGDEPPDESSPDDQRDESSEEVELIPGWDDHWLDPSDQPDGSERDGLDAALMTWHDLPAELAGFRWAPPDQSEERFATPMGVNAHLAECLEFDAYEQWSFETPPDPTTFEDDLTAYEEARREVRDYVAEPLELGDHWQAMLSEMYLDVVHAILPMDDAAAAEHVAKLDEIATLCMPYERPDPDDPERGGGQAEPLDVPDLGDGATGWRLVGVVPEAQPFYIDHVRWHRDDILVTVTISWMPILMAMGMVDPHATDQNPYTIWDDDYAGQLEDLTLTLDQKLVDVLSDS